MNVGRMLGAIGIGIGSTDIKKLRIITIVSDLSAHSHALLAHFVTAALVSAGLGEGLPVIHESLLRRKQYADVGVVPSRQSFNER